MKNFLKKIITWQKDDYITFNLFAVAIITVIVFVVFRDIGETRSATLMAISLWIILIIGINYIIEKTSKKYIVELPDGVDQQIDSCLLITEQGEVSKLDEKWIWSPGGKIYTVESNPPEKNGGWITFYQKNKKEPTETAYLFSITIGEIIFKECREKIFIKLFMEEKFNPLEIHKIYQENNLKPINNRLFIEDALKKAIIKLNEDNENLKNTGIHFNDNFFESIRQNLLIPKLSGVKDYAIYRKKEYYK